MERFVIFSDGGGEKSSSAAAACIVRDNQSGSEFRLAAYLGGATNNESEIFGGLVGFAALRALSGGDGGFTVRWVSDSEYLLKSATGYINQWQRNGWKTAAKQPVKNQGLWRTYLMLSQGLSIAPEHVYGHNGHPENEACDEACTWVRQNVDDSLRSGDGGFSFEIGASGFEEGWRLLNGQPVLELLRELNPERSAIDGLEDLVRAALHLKSGGDQAASNRTAPPAADALQWNRLVAALKQAREAAAKIPTAEAEEIGAALNSLIDNAAAKGARK